MLNDTILADLKAAMLAKDNIRRDTLRMLKSAIEYAKIEQKKEQLSDADILAVIKKQVKQRQDSIAGFDQGGRADLADKEKAEMAVLKSYLPEELSPDQLEEIVVAAIAETGAASKADMGKVMKVVQAKVAGRADNRAVSQMIGSKLA
jgi:uncharacterized protein YqeY